MPRESRALHRLESYQSGGSVGDGGVDVDGVVAVVDDDGAEAGPGVGDDGWTSPPPSPPPNPPMLHQFSLIGEDAAADDDGGGGGGVGVNVGSAGGRSRRRWWRAMIRGRGRQASLVAATIMLCAIFALAIIFGGDDDGVASSPSSSGTPPSEHGETTPPSSPSSSSSSSCLAARYSYSVSPEIMELKNTSTVENVRNGAVASDHPTCSRIGVSILEEGGGNAADAAVATALCLGVANPASSGIGGGAFILVHTGARGDEGDGDDADADADDEMPFDDARSDPVAAAAAAAAGGKGGGGGKITEFIDCRETAPRNSSYDMYENDPGSSTFGGMAVAVPGELRGLELLHRRHGSMPWADVVRPAMELARDGVVVESYLAHAIQVFWKKTPELTHILTKDGDGVTPLRRGDKMVRSQYAKTLEAVMSGGSDVLYRGHLAKMLAKDIRDAGGIITLEDIEDYRPTLRDPLISRVAGYNVVGSPPPSSGGAAIIGALRFLSGYDTPFSVFADTLSMHRYVEACRHVFAIRMSLSDPGFAPIENANAVKDLIEGKYMDLLRNMTLDNDTLGLSQCGGAKWAQLKDTDGNGELVDAQEGDRRRRAKSTQRVDDRMRSRDMRLFNYLEDHGTTSFSVVDKDRNTVTITSSVNLWFGSVVVSPSTGIVLNNQMDDFSSPGQANFFGLRPSEANYISPGKRPLSSMSPTMVFRNDDDDVNGLGRLMLSVGASGGPKIITAVTQAILNHLFVGMPLYESVAAPRVHNQLLYHGAAGTNLEEDPLPQGPLLSLSGRTRLALENRGHKVVPTDFLGTVQAVAVDLETDSLTAVADIRKQGLPAGY